MLVKSFFRRYWRCLLALACVFVGLITAPACKTSSRSGSSPLLIITSVASSNISAVGATITWSTNRPADSQVEYGVTTSYGNVISLARMDQSHRMDLIGLTSNTIYHFRVKSRDDAGNLSVSGDFTFTTARSGSPTPTPTPGPTPTPFPIGDADEFVGPFPSWTNVKTTYGAVGNSSADDTSALQRGLDALSSGSIKTLYIPSGVYRITQTLRVHNTIYINVIGQDPDNTTILWDGPVGGVMMTIDGVAYSRFNRITWDGQGRAEVAIDQSKTDDTSQHFDTGNEYAEDVFRFVGYGIRAGNRGFGAAETSVVRCRFIQNTKAGIITKNFNALDWWVWYSYFDGCNIGLTNDPGAGNFNVYNSVFKGSKVADINLKNTQFYSIRNNYSIGSKKFYFSEDPGQNGSLTVIQGNTILDTVDPDAIVIQDYGPVNIYNNVIRSREGAAGPAIRITKADALAYDNKFTVSNPISANGRKELDGNITVDRGSIVASEPVIPKYVSKNRRVFEAPLDADASTIQQAINNAAQFCGQRPIVHLPAGPGDYQGYQIDRTLEVPANCDIQIVGDGGYTRLSWIGDTGPVIRLRGPSKAILRDLRVHGAADKRGDGVAVETVDAPGSRVYIQEALANVSAQNGLLVDGLDNTRVDLRGFLHKEGLETSSSLKVVGGPLGANGPGRTILISGASSSNSLSYEVAGGRLVVKDVWYETGASPPRPAHIKLTGNGVVTFEQARVYTTPTNTTPPAVDIQNFGGKATFIALDLEDRIRISGTSNGSILGLGLMGRAVADYFINNTSAQAALVNSRRYNGGSEMVANKGSYNVTFLRQMLAQALDPNLSNLSNEYEVIPVNITDVRMYRVYAESVRIGFHIKR